MRTIIKNGTIVNSSQRTKADLIIENGIISEIVENARIEASDQVIDAKGQYIMPGGIDVHAHLDYPGTVDDFESGTKAAAVGGLTSIINYTSPLNGQTVLENVKDWKKRAEKSYIDYGFHAMVTECNDRILSEIPRLASEEGITSIKLFMAYRGESMVNDLEMYKLMKTAGEAGMIINVHAENGDVTDQLRIEAIEQGNTDPIYHAYTRPTTLEAEATNRAIRIAEVANAPVYIVHVSCADALNEIKLAKDRGMSVYGETCPQYLALDDSYLELPDLEGAKYVCSPPLRKKEEQKYLWEGISEGYISTIGSDHSSLMFEGGKTKGKNDFTKIPNGLPSIEDIYHVTYHFGVHEGKIPLEKFVDITSTAPAKIFGLYPQKGTIEKGSDADIILFDPTSSRKVSKETQYQQTDFNIYEGFTLQGAMTHVISRGEIIVKDQKFLGEKGRGNFLPRKHFSENIID